MTAMAIHTNLLLMFSLMVVPAKATAMEEQAVGVSGANLLH